MWKSKIGISDEKELVNSWDWGMNLSGHEISFWSDQDALKVNNSDGNYTDIYLMEKNTLYPMWILF